MKQLSDQLEMVEMVDNFEMSETTKKDVILPYLRDLYHDWISNSDAPDKGVPKVLLLKVFYWSHFFSFWICLG